jgi:hypothetical protein
MSESVSRSPYRYVYFVPWVGLNFENGFKGTRLLIVGESHYTDWPDSDRVVRRHKLGPAFTATTVQSFFETGGDGAPTWWRIEELLHDEEKPNAQFWHSVAFYNFVQFPLEGAPKDGVHPTDEQWLGSTLAFRELLENLRPDRIYMFGKTTWDNSGSNRTEIKGESDGYPDGYYQLSDGFRCFATFSRHPGSPFHWPSAQQRGPYIRNFIKVDQS